MANPYGPWATLMDVGPNPQLSAFWKRRMTMLVPASRTSPVLSRRSALGLGAAGVLMCVAPTLRSAALLAEEKAPAGEGKKPSPGRIYLDASCMTKREAYKDTPHPEGIIAIDPETGRWERIRDGGYSVRLSPDGKTIAFMSFESSNGAPKPAGIWNYDLATGKSVRIPAEGGFTCWSPDGKQVVVTTAAGTGDGDKNLGNRREKWLVAADGSKRTKLHIPEPDQVQDVSPDGKWLALVSNRHPPFGRGYQLYRMRLDGTEELRLTKDGLNCYPRFSPDSRRIVYLHQTGRDGNSLHVINVDGTDDREILREEYPASVEAACWSPDGSRLAVVRYNWGFPEGVHIMTPEGKKPEKHVGHYDSRIEIMDPDGKNRREIRLAKRDDIWLGHPDWR